MAILPFVFILEAETMQPCRSKDSYGRVVSFCFSGQIDDAQIHKKP